jgi:hypothetical protein
MKIVLYGFTSKLKAVSLIESVRPFVGSLRAARDLVDGLIGGVHFFIEVRPGSELETYTTFVSLGALCRIEDEMS